MNLQKLGIFYDSPLDKIIFKLAREKFGGRIKYCLCGGAKVDSNVINYLQAVLNIRIIQGYGQTEGLGANIIGNLKQFDTSSVGTPFTTTQVKLVSFAENSQDYAVYLKGPAITKGYHIPSDKEIEFSSQFEQYKTVKNVVNEKLIDENGFLDTGDVARYKNGKIFIVDRTKNLIKLSNGEYISPEDVENSILFKSTFSIAEVYVNGSAKMDAIDLVLFIKGKVHDQKALIKRFIQDFKSLMSHNLISKHLKVEKVLIKDNFDPNQISDLYTPTLKKKIYSFKQRFGHELNNNGINVSAINN